MKLSQALVEARPKKFRKPEKQRRKNGKGCRHAHYQVKVPDHEIFADGGGPQVVASQKNARKSAGQKQRDEPDGKQHRRGQLDPGIP